LSKYFLGPPLHLCSAFFYQATAFLRQVLAMLRAIHGPILAKDSAYQARKPLALNSRGLNTDSNRPAKRTKAEAKPVRNAPSTSVSKIKKP
jgi:hypothetical protein